MLIQNKNDLEKYSHVSCWQAGRLSFDNTYICHVYCTLEYNKAGWYDAKFNNALWMNPGNTVGLATVGLAIHHDERRGMKTLSALLAIDPLWGESTYPITCLFSSKGPVIRAFDLPSVVSLNTLLQKYLSCWWLMTPWPPCDVGVMLANVDGSWRALTYISLVHTR